jgi:hypothetical protein
VQPATLKYARRDKNGWPVIPQNFAVRLGTVTGRVFFYGSGPDNLPKGSPWLFLVAERKAGTRGRPARTLDAIRRTEAAPDVTLAYAVDMPGNWYSIRYTADGRATARNLSDPPYGKLPRQHWRQWSTEKMQAAAAAELGKAWRALTGCDLI